MAFTFFHVIFFNYRGDVDMLLLDLGKLSVTSEKNALCDENKVIFYVKYAYTHSMISIWFHTVY